MIKRIIPHRHDHSGGNDPDQSRLTISIILNLLITVSEIIGGIISNSLSLLSDALHNLNDSVSLAISLFARKVSKKEADVTKTFGYKRAEIIGAFINLVTLVLISLFLIKEGIERFFDPQIIAGPVMFIIALVGLIGNFVTAILLHRGSKESINLKSAYLHILSDGLSSIGVIIAGFLIIQYQWYFVDTILTLIIAGYILIQSFGMLKQTINILMEGSPTHLDPKEIAEKVSNMDGVENMHHVHIWNLDESNYLFEAHVLIKKGDLEFIEQIKKDIKQELETKYRIHHSTLEFEFENCTDQQDKDCAEPISQKKFK